MKRATLDMSTLLYYVYNAILIGVCIPILVIVGIQFATPEYRNAILTNLFSSIVQGVVVSIVGCAALAMYERSNWLPVKCLVYRRLLSSLTAVWDAVSQGQSQSRRLRFEFGLFASSGMAPDFASITQSDLDRMLDKLTSEYNVLREYGTQRNASTNESDDRDNTFSEYRSSLVRSREQLEQALLMHRRHFDHTFTELLLRTIDNIEDIEGRLAGSTDTILLAIKARALLDSVRTIGAIIQYSATKQETEEEYYARLERGFAESSGEPESTVKIQKGGIVSFLK